MLDKSRNFIKLKGGKEKLPGMPGRERSAAEQIVFQDGGPIAMLVQDAENMHRGVGIVYLKKGNVGRKQQKTEIQKRKLREMIVCRLHPVMA